MVALPNGTLAVFRGKAAPHPGPAANPRGGTKPRPRLSAARGARTALPPRLRAEGRGVPRLQRYPRRSPGLSPPLLPHNRALLLAAERPDPADHQPAADPRRLGHPVPHRRRVLQVQLRRQDLLHQGGQPSLPSSLLSREGQVLKRKQKRSLVLHVLLKKGNFSTAWWV